MAHGATQPAGNARIQGDSPVGQLPDAVLEALCDELLARGGRVWRYVTSDSMAPMLQAGDRILIEPCAGRIRWGDVIVFRSAAGSIVHRVIGVRRGRAPLLIEKGDANPFAGTVSPAAVVGRVCRRDREGRSVDMVHGSGRLIQVALTLLSMVELAGLLAGRGLRRLLRIERPTGIATRIAGVLHIASERVARLLGPE